MVMKKWVTNSSRHMASHILVRCLMMPQVHRSANRGYYSNRNLRAKRTNCGGQNPHTNKGRLHHRQNAVNPRLQYQALATTVARSLLSFLRSRRKYPTEAAFGPCRLSPEKELSPGLICLRRASSDRRTNMRCRPK
jgi:hypothetical protein